MALELLKVTKRSYFPTMIFQVDVPKPKTLIAKLFSNIHSEQERDLKGIRRSNFTELGG